MRILIVTGCVILCASAALGQMETEMNGTSPVRGFGTSTAKQTSRTGVLSQSGQSTASLHSHALLEKAPARLNVPAKATSGAGGKPTGPVETRVLETGIDAKDFLQIISPSLGKGLSAKQIDEAHVAVTGTSQTLKRISDVSQQIRTAIHKPAKRLRLHVALLSDQLEDEASDAKAPALSASDLPQALESMHLSAEDFDKLGLPEKLYKLADMTATATGGGENRVQLNDRISLLYELRPTLAGDYEVALNLAEKDKGANPFDASIGRIIFANHFRADTAHPVVLGITNPERTIMIALRLEQ